MRAGLRPERSDGEPRSASRVMAVRALVIVALMAVGAGVLVATDDDSPAAVDLAASGAATTTTAPADSPAHGAGEHDHSGLPDGQLAEPKLVEQRDGQYVYDRGGGTFEHSAWPLGKGPTAAQQAAADAFVADVERSLRRFEDYDAAVAAGYVERPGVPVDPDLPIGDDPHVFNLAYANDGVTLQADRPESLIYVPTPSGQVLVGAMFLAPRGSVVDQIGGPLTRWHYHVFPEPQCYRQEIISTAAPDGRCEGGVLSDRSPEMLHVWLDNPRGRFDADMAGAWAATEPTTQD